MGKFVALGLALLPAAGAAAGIVGAGAFALGGLAIASSIQSLTAGGGGGGGNLPGVPSVPSASSAQQAANAQTREQKRRTSKRIFTSQEEQSNLLATPSTTEISLLGQ
jgi:hypothetical protein